MCVCVCGGGVELRTEPRSHTKAALPPRSPRLFLFGFVVLPGTRTPQLFSDQNVFHNKPSGAFPHRAGAGRHALLTAAMLLTSGQMCFEVCSFHG